MAIIGTLYKVEKLLKSSDLKVVFDYLKDASEKETEVNQRIFSMPVGSFEKVKLTEDIFALEQVYYTKDRKDCFVESHKNYIDFQLHLAGVEQMEMIDIENLIIKEQYNEAKDLIIYEKSDKTSKIVMTQNMLSIFLPADAHVGLPMFGNQPDLVRKTVVKFPVSKFNV